MTSDVFIDASAIVAILLQEDDRQRLTAAMMAAERRFTSAVALYETAVTLARRWKGDMNGANSSSPDLRSGPALRYWLSTKGLTRSPEKLFGGSGKGGPTP